MAHFAKLDNDNNVLEVVVVHNDVINNLDYPDSEPIGVQFLTDLFSYANWKQTSYNNNFRKRLAGIGGTYDPVNDVFLTPKPWDSWVLNNTTFKWEAPIPYPTDGKWYDWNESTQNWILSKTQPKG
jgi:hypothetical protein